MQNQVDIPANIMKAPHGQVLMPQWRCQLAIIAIAYKIIMMNILHKFCCMQAESRAESREKLNEWVMIDHG